MLPVVAAGVALPYHHWAVFAAAGREEEQHQHWSASPFASAASVRESWIASIAASASVVARACLAESAYA